MLTIASNSMFLAQSLPSGLVSLAVIFFVVAIVAYLFGAKGVAGMSAGVGRTLLMVFVVLAVVMLVIGFLNRTV